MAKFEGDILNSPGDMVELYDDMLKSGRQKMRSWSVISVSHLAIYAVTILDKPDKQLSCMCEEMNDRTHRARYDVRSFFAFALITLCIAVVADCIK